MATSPNLRFWNITVFEGSKTIFTKRCVTVAEANTLLKQKREEFPAPKYTVLKELF